jgi:hypothetical protein
MDAESARATNARISRSRSESQLVTQLEWASNAATCSSRALLVSGLPEALGVPGGVAAAAARAVAAGGSDESSFQTFASAGATTYMKRVRTNW